MNGKNRLERLGYYSDLATERRRAQPHSCGVEFEKVRCAVGVWERVRITDEEGARALRRPVGSYETLHTDRLDLVDGDIATEISEEISKKLLSFCKRLSVVPNRILAVGLGNPRLTPDSVGPIAAGDILPTMHLQAIDGEYFDALSCSEIAVSIPNVTAESGIDTLHAVRALCREISPRLVILIDSILTSSPERLGSSVQICDTGIAPGSGIGNHSKAINRESLGVPVFSIGVPTVIDARALWEDGCPKNGNLLVAPREIDSIVKAAGRIVGEAVNRAFGIIGI